MRVTLGLGCDRGTSLATLEQAVRLALAALPDASTTVQVVGAASISLKADELGLLALAHAHGWPLRFYTPTALAAIAVPNPSEAVRRHTGTPSVSEAAALLLAGNPGPQALLVEKLRVKGADGRHATVSIARADGPIPSIPSAGAA